ncbi:MAG: VOC family protein [SAR202 cluster bacterium]|nr:VOC family protein [SAR202 cluster bacterium]
MTFQSISAVTLAVQDMARALAFYRDQLEMPLRYGDAESEFCSFRVGQGYLNLVLAPAGGWSWWGRVIFYVDDVDALHQRLTEAGVPGIEAPPKDASWGERYFHVTDPDGHELSFARPLAA